jgi:mono/diheme cytochrome c family protein
MVYGFIIVWIALGLGVFFVAMRGGPRGARQAVHGESKLSNRVLATVLTVVFAFGLGVPALVIAFNSSDKASVAVGDVHLNGAQQRGRELFARSCVTCHTLAAVKSDARVGPNLDILLPEVSSTVSGRRALVLSAILEGRARGRGQMPALLYQGREAEDIANFVAAVAGH